MKVVALISGGKDSCYNMMQCVAEGHSIVALANLRPEGKDELDSYMYQTVGHHAIDFYAEAMDLPLYRRTITGHAHDKGKHYSPCSQDEVEDLYELLAEVKRNQEVESVSVGAIMSDYQRVRVENVCSRLNLTVLAYLWRRHQDELLNEMIQSGVHAIIIKVAALGLQPDKHLGMSLTEIYPTMLNLAAVYGLNVCGEGGEYETFTLDCPLFNNRIVIDDQDIVIHTDDPYTPVAYINLKSLHLEEKNIKNIPVAERICKLAMKRSSDCLSELEITGDLSPLLKLSFRESNELASEIQSRVSVDIISSDLYIGGVCVACSDDELQQATEEALKNLGSTLRNYGMEYSDVCVVNLYIRDMDSFGRINDVYKQFFSKNPPIRICVQANLCRNQTLLLNCYAHKLCESAAESSMYVRGLSHWAPANIGPYSQCKQLGSRIYVAGQIPLVPGSMVIVDGGIVAQCRLSLRHVTRVIEAMTNQRSSLCDVFAMICYVTHQDYVEVVAEEWTRAKGAASVDAAVIYCVVPRLPRDAAVEWEAIADTMAQTYRVTIGHGGIADWSLTSRDLIDENGGCVMSYITIDCVTPPSESADTMDNISDLITSSLAKMTAKCAAMWRVFYRYDKLHFDHVHGVVNRAVADHAVTFSLVPVTCFRSLDTIISILI